MERFNEADMRIATLAGRILPLTKTLAGRVFAAEITRQFSDEERAAYPCYMENEVGAALRYLEKNGCLISKKARHPDGHAAHVRLYTITPRGAFILSLTAAQQSNK